MWAAVALVLLPQGDPDSALARFRDLDRDQQQEALDHLQRQVLADPDPTIQRIVSMAKDFESYPEFAPRPFHDPRVWARGAAPRRRMVTEGTPSHVEVRSRIPVIEILPDLHKAVFYDWGRSRVVRRAEPLSPEEVVANMLAGYPPGADQALAGVLAILDRDPEQHKLAAYLEHLYADLDAMVYEGITLYEAWYSEHVIDVPDVDAIPFAREILETTRYRSPIPRGPERAYLYQRISEGAFAHRIYRTLREAAAGAFVNPEPGTDPTYASLASRFHYLFATMDHDPARLAEHMDNAGDRDTLLEQADREVETDPDAFDAREKARRDLTDMQTRLRRIVFRILEDSSPGP